MAMDTDTEFREYRLEKVTANSDGTGWEVGFDDCMCCYVPNNGPVPKVGSLMRQYGRQWGPIRGIVIDGATVYYRTVAEDDAKHKAEAEAHDQKQREDFEKNRESIDARVSALPPIFQSRLHKFRENNPDFRWKYEGYELFTCEEAVKIAAACETVEGVRAFHELEYKAQRAKVPTLSDGHSGNTFGMACTLALDYLSEPGNVQKRHGALAVLVGSEEYGCVPRGKEPAHAQ